MSNPEHLEILKQGVDTWNQRRSMELMMFPDLHNADLRDLYLSGIDFHGANLSGANLLKSNLKEANLQHADLSGADLGEANLEGAHLRCATLTAADLRGANLSNTDIIGADLRNANLCGAMLYSTFLNESELSGADFSDINSAFSSLVNLDLSTVKGLDKVRHHGPSFTGLETLFKSNGKIPEVFLRGCGFPDQMIAYANSLTGNSLEYFTCYILYGEKDEEFAKRLWEGLQANNVRCWYFKKGASSTSEHRPIIDELIRLHDKIFLVISENSIEERWLRQESMYALSHEIKRSRPTLFPIRIDDAVVNNTADWVTNLRTLRHIEDFSGWTNYEAFQSALDGLLQGLKTRL